ncbi:MAG: spore cortex-lytic enzyme [Bacillota bacterium]
MINNLSTIDELEDAGSILLKYGSRGEQVKTVQTKLKRWGYYNGSVDGVYGWRTREAVVKFQRKNGLRADGVVGSATAKALGMRVAAAATRGGGGARENEVYTLAQCIHGEARGESYTGQVAVGAVVLNRVDDPRFPNTISGVIFQPGAFTAVADGQMFMRPNDSALRAARDALNGWDPSGGALYYYNPAKTTNKWIWSRPIIKVIGKHYFCK